MKSYFMDELHSIRAEIVTCKNKTKYPNSVDARVSELQNKIGILEAEHKLLKENSALIKRKSKHVVNPNYKVVSLNESKCEIQNHMVYDKYNGKKV